MNINEDIAKLYLSDSLEFIVRYNSLEKHQSYMGNRSKNMIDLLFSLECNLKALAFLESKSSEKEIYKRIKTHNLKQLLLQVNLDSLPEVKEFILKNLTYLKVEVRYLIVANTIFRNNTGVLNKCYHETIANPIWMKKFYDINEKLHCYVGNKIEWLKIENLSEINIDEQIEKVQRMKNIEVH